MASLFSNKARIISHVHCNHENMRKICLKTLLFGFFSHRFEKIVWVSKSAFNNYIFNRKVRKKSIVLYNSINDKEIINFINKDNKDYPNYDLIYLGRFTYQKNPERMINIVSRIIEKGIDIHMAMVGNGELLDEVKKMVKENHLDNNITLYGFVENPYKILSNSKLMIMTSRYEGTPMCALEALSLGIPIISTPTDGLKDIISNGKNGYLSDSDDILIDKICLYLKNKKVYDNISYGAKKFFNDNCNIDNYKKNIRKIYEQ